MKKFNVNSNYLNIKFIDIIVNSKSPGVKMFDIKQKKTLIMKVFLINIF